VFVLGIVDPQETILASYKVATTIPTALSFIPIALVTYLYPFFAEHKDDGKWCLNRYRQTIIGIGCLNLALSAILFAGAPLIVRIIFGAQYSDAVPVFRILAVNYFVSGTFRTISGNLLVTQRKLQFNLVVAIVSSLINVIADYFFIQWWGSVGAAYATLLVVTVSSILSTSCLVLTFRKKAQENRQKAEQA
jgi:O-antigen/teichoic acid export membrane protein